MILFEKLSSYKLYIFEFSAMFRNNILGYLCINPHKLKNPLITIQFLHTKLFYPHCMGVPQVYEKTSLCKFRGKMQNLMYM